MRLNELYSKYRDRMHFYMVYIREAHPHDGWRVPNSLIEDINYYEPSTLDERVEVANACQLHLGIDMPMLVDSIDNSVDEKYVGLPMRLFLVDSAGKIAFAGKKGPFGWDDVAFEDAVKALLKA